MAREQIINEEIQFLKGIVGLDTNKISDGYHTFGELYEHRIQLYINYCKALDEIANLNNILEEYSNFINKPVYNSGVWRSKVHSDGSVWDGWFLLGLHVLSGKQITYHLPISKWKECNFAHTLDKAPAFDGHTSADVLERLKQL